MFIYCPYPSPLPRKGVDPEIRHASRPLPVKETDICIVYDVQKNGTGVVVRDRRLSEDRDACIRARLINSLQQQKVTMEEENGSSEVHIEYLYLITI